MLKTVIVDDEKRSREALKSMVQQFCNDMAEVVCSCSNVQDGLKAIATHSPDVVFLDIEMRGETGFDLLREVEPEHEGFATIITTGHSEYAVRAIKFSPTDYLLKPIDISELRAALEKVQRKKQTYDPADEKSLSRFINELRSEVGQHSKLALPTSDGLVFIEPSDILYLKASGNYTEIHMTNSDKYLVSRQLKEYERILENKNFFRIHHSFLINLVRIKRYFKGDGGYVVLDDDTALDVSRRKKEAFLERIGYRTAGE